MQFLSTLSVYNGATDVLLLAAFVGAIVFNWQFAIGRWPRLSFFKATCVGWAIDAASICVIVSYFADKYAMSFNDVAVYFADKSPGFYVTPIIIAPITVLFWRWVFKEVREEKKLESSIASQQANRIS